MTETLDQALNRLAQAVPKSIDLSLGRIEAVLEKLGSPHKRLPPVIHLAGTNGKGSTLAFLRAIYKAAGYQVHSYSSPHIVSFCERIHLNNHDITPEVFAAAIEDFLKTGLHEVTFFEALTLIAVQLFAAHPADVLILETGLGGRGDATNVVDQKLATILTPVSMDHQDRLGDTLEKIAREKIAIFRPKTPIFCGLQDPKVANLVHQAADDLGAPVSMFGVDFSSEYSLTNMVWQDLKTGDTLTLPAPPLKGAHQIHNAALAVTCVRGLESVLPVAHEALIQGITQTFWPARLQSVSPVVFGLPESWSVYVDGSHNAAGAETLRVFLNAQLWQRRILVMGCLARKDWKSIVDTLASWPTEIHLVPVTGHETSWDLGEVAGYLQTKGHDVTTHSDWRAALAVANKDNVSLPTGLIITGSLYLAGEVLKDTRGV